MTLKKIMIIDDTEIDLYITARTISKNNFCEEILSYSAAQPALDYLRSNMANKEAWPDIIFVDIYMPVMSGFQFMEAFDQLPLPMKQHCKVFIASSSSDLNDINRANNNKNVTGFKEKPITAAFLNTINTDR